jgi:hypothetical protein
MWFQCPNHPDESWCATTYQQWNQNNHQQWQEQCPTETQPRSTTNREAVQCFNYREFGHYVNHCPARQNQTPSQLVKNQALVVSEQT